MFVISVRPVGGATETFGVSVAPGEAVAVTVYISSGGNGVSSVAFSESTPIRIYTSSPILPGASGSEATRALGEVKNPWNHRLSFNGPIMLGKKCKNDIALRQTVEKREQVIASYVNLQGFSWSQDQVKVGAFRNFPNRALMIQGSPGAGKTLTIAAMAPLFVFLGMHVIFATPTHCAADSICDAFDAFGKLSGTSEVEFLRSYRSWKEMKAFQGGKVPHGQANERELVEEAQLLMLTHGAAFSDAFDTKCYGIPEKPLEVRVVALAAGKK